MDTPQTIFPLWGGGSRRELYLRMYQNDQLVCHNDTLDIFSFLCHNFPWYHHAGGGRYLHDTAMHPRFSDQEVSRYAMLRCAPNGGREVFSLQSRWRRANDQTTGYGEGRGWMGSFPA